MDYKIRKMTTEDFDAALALWRRTDGIGLDPECDSIQGLTNYLIRNPGQSFVACRDNELVGTVLCGHDGRRGYLHHLAVAEDFRRQGIGNSLIERCIAALKKEGIPKCNIFLFSDNDTGKQFWLNTEWTLRGDLSVLQKYT